MRLRWRGRGSGLSADALVYDEVAAAADAVVVGDADELRAAVWNLIDNAVKYSPADDVSIQVRLEERREGEWRCGSPIAAWAFQPPS